MTHCPTCARRLIAGFGCIAHGEPRESPTVAPIVKARPHKRWTQAEQTFAVEHMGTLTSLQIGEALGKTEKSVKHFFERAHISKPRPQRQRMTRRPRPAPELRHNQRWTEDELVELECGEVRILFGQRTPRAVVVKRYREGHAAYQDGCLSARECARTYSMTVWRVTRMLIAGTLPATRYGTRLWRIDPLVAERVLTPLSPATPFRTHPSRPPHPLATATALRRVAAMREEE